MKDHPELKYYSSLSQLANGLEGIYVLAPYIKNWILHQMKANHHRNLRR